MPFYESTFIVKQVATTAQVEALTASLSELVRKQGGDVTKVEQWGLRSLAYRIEKNKKGHYVHLNLDAPPAAVHELERTLRFNEEVLRFLTVKVDELETGPSAMLRKAEERDFRDDDGPRFSPSGRGARPPRRTETGV